MLYSRLYETQEKLERDEEALVDHAKVNRRMQRLRNAANNILLNQKINMENCLTEENEKSLGRDHMVLSH